MEAAAAQKAYHLLERRPNMKMVFRYFGPRDPIPLSYIAQIPGVQGIVSSVYEVKAGDPWSLSSLLSLKEKAAENHLGFEVIESIPVPEPIKLGSSDRDAYIEVYKHNLELAGEIGVKCVCYNFMPVFDWLRSDLRAKNPDGSFSLSYRPDDLLGQDPAHLHLPGWDESYDSSELKGLLDQYQGFSHQRLFDNLVYFLKALEPTLEKTGIDLAIHPDDPPWDVFGLPRVVSSEADLDRLFAAVPSKHNGLTLCVGSFGESRDNDVVRMAGKYAEQGRIFFAHLRNIRYLKEEGSFIESGHETCKGSLDMAAVVQALVDNGFQGYVRPDHGRDIWGEQGRPGYGLYDRALGAAYLNGLFEMAEKRKGKRK